MVKKGAKMVNIVFGCPLTRIAGAKYYPCLKTRRFFLFSFEKCPFKKHFLRKQRHSPAQQRNKISHNTCLTPQIGIIIIG